MTSSVIFIDWRVEDPQSIIAGLPADSAWYILTPDEGGIDQMRRILAGYADLDSIQIVSHGSDGAIQLGATVVDTAGLTAEVSALAEIGGALSASGDLLLYGCDVGQGEVGRAFVDALAGLTGADVAASADRTGAAALGGNWTLEVASGTIETPSLSAVGYASLLPLGPATTHAVIAPTIAFKAEGLTGTSSFTFTVTRVSGDLTVAQNVDWAVSGDGPDPAVASDFVGNVLPSGTLNFGVNQVSATITVNVLGGFSAEPSEGFTVTLSNPTNGLTIDTPTAGATIIDGTGIVYRASIDPVGTEANGFSSDPSLATGGALVAFASESENLVPGGDGNEASDIFIKDLTTGLVQRISMGFAGDQADASSFNPVFSPTGGKIAFVSQASNLVVGDTNFAQDIFIWSNGTITRVSTNAQGGEADGSSSAPAFSPDGTKLVFVSSASNLVADDQNGTDDIFVKDLLSGDIVRVSASASGEEAQGDGEGGGYSYQPIFSPDASRVAFVSIADNLVSDDTNGVTDVFVKTLTGSPSGAIVRVSVSADNVEANGSSYDPAFSPDGSRVAFTSDASNLLGGGNNNNAFNLPGDDNNASDIFIKNLSDGSITLVSTNAAGTQANGNSWGAVFSPDGARIFFLSSASNLVAGDTNDATDIFVKDLFTGAIARISTDSSGAQATGGEVIQFVLSPDGNHIAFNSSATNLVLDDFNEKTDIFIRSVSTVVVSATDAVKAEGQTGFTSFTFTVTRSGDLTQAQSVAWAVAGSGVVPADASDFNGPLSGFVAFAAGETSKTVTLSVSADTIVESDEGFTITLSAPSAGLYIMGPSADGTIQNDDLPTVSISPASVSHLEGNSGITEFTFTVSLDQSVTNFESVQWKVTGSGDHHADAADFGGTLLSGLVTFSYYDTTATVSVFVTGDVAAEFTEGFTVTLFNASPGLAIGTSTAAGTIENDDASTVSIAPPLVAKAEGNSGTTTFSFAVTLNQAAVTDQTVKWAVTSSGAHFATAADFGGLLPSGTVTFAAGTTTATVDISVSGDTTVEFDEEFTVTLSNASSGLSIGTSTASGKIENDDFPTVSIAADSASKPEGDSGSTSFSFTVSLDKADVVPRTVNWAVTGTGAHGADAADFGGSLPAGQVSFAAGETSKTVFVLVSSDTTIEFDEDFTVTLSSPTPGLALGTSTASSTIQNDDSAVASIAPLSAVRAEGTGGTTAFTFTVSLDRSLLVDQSVQWSVTGSGGHPANAADFGGTLPSGFAFLAAGETSVTLTVLVSGDGAVEFDEGFTVTLSNATSGLILGTSSATGTIQNDDVSTVSVAPLAATRPEGNGGPTAFTFTVSLDQAGATSQTVNWAVTGTGAHAANATDFGGSLPAGSVTFAAGETSKIVTVSASGDTTVEFDEGFAVTLSGASSGLALGVSTASATIQNDDRSSVSITALSAVKPEGDGGPTSFTFTVSLDQAAVAGQTVDWAVAGSGTHAANSADFGGSLPSGSVTFAAGETSKTLTVTASGDTAVEFDEDFTVTLSNVSAGLTLGTSSASGTIQNDDRSIVSIAAVSASVAEGDSGTTPFTFKITLDQAGVTSQSIAWAVTGSGVHPADAADFGAALPAGAVTFAPGEVTKMVTFDIAGDTALEFNESFAVTLASPSTGLTLGTSATTGTITNDDGLIVSIAELSAANAERNDGMAFFTFTVRLNHLLAIDGPTVDWTVTGSGDHPADAADFGGILPSGTATFGPNQQVVVVTVLVSGDTLVEADETFTVTLSNPSQGLTLGVETASGTIRNDDVSVVSIAAASAAKAEGNGGGTTAFTFTVSLDQAGVTAQSVDWSVAGIGAHAAAAGDFAGGLPSGSVTFAAGETTKTLTVEVAADGMVEFDEGFVVTLANASSGLTLGTTSATGTILNDDRPIASVVAGSASQPEGDSGTTSFTFTVSLDQAGLSGQTLDWAVSGSGPHAASAADFGGSLPSGSLTFAAGETSKIVIVTVSGDAAVEFDETFTLTLSNASSGLALGTASADGTIVNDDRPVASIAPLSAIKPEGDGGSTSFTFTVSLDQAAVANQTLAWSVTGSGAHAADAGDFGGTLPSGAITFAAGETSKTVMVAVSGDTTAEFDETFTIALSNASPGLQLGTASAQGTIQDDDKPTVSVAALAATQLEGDAGTTGFTFTLSLSQAAVASQTVAWAVSGSGVHPADAADFGSALPAGIVTFAAGETSKTVTVAVSGDLAPEFDEGFSLALSSPSAGLALGTSSASGTILNDDHPQSSLTIAPLAAVRAEGSSGPTSFTFVLSLDAASNQPATIDWAISGSGAHAANAADFGGILPTGTVTFAAGETSKVLTVAVSGDTAVEFDEDFEVTLSNPSADLDLVTATAIGTILNDDRSKVSIAAQSAAKPEGTGGTTAFSFVVSLDQAALTSQTVDWSVTGSGAHAANAVDFGGALPFGTVTFAAGETTKTVTLLVSADALPEFNETFDVSLANASAGLALGTATASGTIQNDDLSVSIAALAATKAEGNAGTTPFTFLVTLTGDTSIAHSVDYAVSFSGGDPAVSSDFVGNAFGFGTISFAPGETSKTLVVNVAGDVVKEANETFIVTLSSPSAGLAIGSASATGTILNDDSLPSLPPAAHDDAYIDFPGQVLHIGAPSGVLFNDDSTVPLTASLLTGPAHGTLALASDGGFDYTPDPGFFGIDSFAYRAAGIGSTSDQHALIYVTPLAVAATSTLDLTRLSTEEQVAATYAAFFGRGGDAAGHEFWVDEFTAGAASQTPTTLFANIASSFAISDEAKGLYPFLVNPFGASDSQIGVFLDTIYHNLFNRSGDAAGLAYWTGQIRETLASGQFVGSVLVNIMSGAQNTTDGQDITTLMGKIAVGLSYVHDQESLHAPWAAADDAVDATALLHAVTADPQTVLVGIVQAYNLTLNSLARADGFGGTPTGVS
jgi:Tol biopolymer transport system component